MARVGACAELWLSETGHPRDIWAEIELVPETADVFRLVPCHGEESALELADALGGAGTRERHAIGPVTVIMTASLLQPDPWSGPPRSLPLSLPWIATIAARAAQAVLEDIGARRRLQRETLPLVWLARAAAAALDRRARLREAPRSPETTIRGKIVALR